MKKQEIYDIMEEYKLDYTLPEYNFRSQKRIEEISNARWAIDELENYIFGNWEKQNPIDCCNTFIVDMTYYMHRYPKTRQQFFMAIDIAEDVRDIFICAMKGDCL